MRRLLDPEDVTPASLALLVLAALATAVAGYLHLRLYHRGYAQVEVVGPLFLLNGIATIVTLLFLAFKRITLFGLSVLGINVGAIVSILISHSSAFFGFAEGGYDATAKTILIAEIAAVVLLSIAWASTPVGERTTARGPGRWRHVEGSRSSVHWLRESSDRSAGTLGGLADGSPCREATPEGEPSGRAIRPPRPGDPTDMPQRAARRVFIRATTVRSPAARQPSARRRRPGCACPATNAGGGCCSRCASRRRGPRLRPGRRTAAC